MTDVWWAPIGAGRLEVRELLGPEVWHRYFAADPEVELELGTTRLPDRVLELRARRFTRLLCSEGQVVAELDVSGPPDLTGGWDKPLTLLGTPGRALLQTDESRPSRLRGALRYLRISVGERQWVWHFAGGRAAGERLVLCRGEVPGGTPVVITFPSARGRSLGSLKGGATSDTRVVTWEPAASRAEVVIAELCAMSSLHGLVDYRGARIAEGVSELLGHLPRAEPNTA